MTRGDYIGQIDCYNVLKRSDHAMSAKDIGKILQVNPENISYFLMRLYKRGCIDRVWYNTCFMYSIAKEDRGWRK